MLKVSPYRNFMIQILLSLIVFGVVFAGVGLSYDLYSPDDTCATFCDRMHFFDDPEAPLVDLLADYIFVIQANSLAFVIRLWLSCLLTVSAPR